MSEQSVDYCFADGVFYVHGLRTHYLMDIPGAREIKFEERFLPHFEKLALGWDFSEYEAFVPRLLEENIIRQGAPAFDPEIRKKIDHSDRYFFHDEQYSARDKEVREFLLRAHAYRKRFLGEVGQCPVIPETGLRRALLVGYAADVGQKDVLCIGDDDMVSVALAAMGHRVTVYDIDPYLINLLRTAREDLGLDFEIVNQDLCKPLSGNLQERFDVFLTDPMSNRQCFEIFLSRAFALLKPEGQGFVAVFPPAMNVFAELAEDMNFEINHWYRRFNRYYSHLLAIHDYESDWVHVQKKDGMNLRFPPEVPIPGFDLYREDYFNRDSSLSLTIEGVENLKYAKPFYLGLLLDSVLAECGFEERGRETFAGNTYSATHSLTDDGYITIYSFPAQERILVDLYPLNSDIEAIVRGAFMRVFKANPKRFRIISQRSNWEIRLS
ncbi:MAG: hypothetical protein CMH60_07920 [Myxococcales bacterium]|nr:hypothetical protein [Myxococcales bacterium]